MSFSQIATSRTVVLSEKTLNIWVGFRLPPFWGGGTAGSAGGASAGAVPLVSLTGAAGAFACAASEGEVIAGWSGGDSVFFLAIAFLSFGAVEDPEPHPQPLTQVRVLDVGDEPTDACILGGKDVAPRIR